MAAEQEPSQIESGDSKSVMYYILDNLKTYRNEVERYLQSQGVQVPEGGREEVALNDLQKKVEDAARTIFGVEGDCQHQLDDFCRMMNRIMNDYTTFIEHADSVVGKSGMELFYTKLQSAVLKLRRREGESIVNGLKERFIERGDTASLEKLRDEEHQQINSVYQRDEMVDYSRH